MRLLSNGRCSRVTGAGSTLAGSETLARLSGLAARAGLRLRLLWWLHSRECRGLKGQAQELPFFVLRFLVPYADRGFVAATGYSSDERALNLVLGEEGRLTLAASTRGADLLLLGLPLLLLTLAEDGG